MMIIELKDESITHAIAQRVARVLKAQDVLLLQGDLGSGKSFLCRSIIKKLCPQATHIPSPTFSLINTYSYSHFDIWHLDLYRINNTKELTILGIEEALQENNVFFVEWPDKIIPFIDDNHRVLKARFYFEKDMRMLELTSSSTIKPFPISSLVA